MRWRRGRARAEPEEGDDRWSPPLSQAQRAVKAVQGEPFPREGGGNRAGCHTPVLKSIEPKPPFVCPGCLITRIATI
jgi:hypothetical protein